MPVGVLLLNGASASGDIIDVVIDSALDLGDAVGIDKGNALVAIKVAKATFDVARGTFFLVLETGKEVVAFGTRETFRQRAEDFATRYNVASVLYGRGAGQTNRWATLFLWSPPMGPDP